MWQLKKKLTHTFKERACIDYLVIKYDRQVTSIVTLTETAGHVHYLLACHKESCQKLNPPITMTFANLPAVCCCFI